MQNSEEFPFVEMEESNLLTFTRTLRLEMQIVQICLRAIVTPIVAAQLNARDALDRKVGVAHEQFVSDLSSYRIVRGDGATEPPQSNNKEVDRTKYQSRKQNIVRNPLYPPKQLYIFICCSRI